VTFKIVTDQLLVARNSQAPCCLLNNSLPSGITLSGRFSLKRLQWPNMNTTNIEMHNFEINWKVPSQTKAADL
jgi:hypothetical protein